MVDKKFETLQHQLSQDVIPQDNDEVVIPTKHIIATHNLFTSEST
jgi:hypothetical protein